MKFNFKSEGEEEKPKSTESIFKNLVDHFGKSAGLKPEKGEKDDPVQKVGRLRNPQYRYDMYKKMDRDELFKAIMVIDETLDLSLAANTLFIETLDRGPRDGKLDNDTKATLLRIAKSILLSVALRIRRLRDDD